MKDMDKTTVDKMDGLMREVIEANKLISGINDKYNKGFNVPTVKFFFRDGELSVEVNSRQLRTLDI